MPKRKGAPLSLRGLTQRINRALAAKGQKLIKARRGPALDECGQYFIVDTDDGFVAGKNVDVEALGREIGALRSYERLVE